jgi:hypothetical protein
VSLTVFEGEDIINEEMMGEPMEIVSEKDWVVKHFHDGR